MFHAASIVRSFAIVFVLLLLAACGFGENDPDTLLGGDNWRHRAEFSCAAEFSQANAYFTPISPIRGRGSCGIARPLEVNTSLDGIVRFEPAATLGCPMVSALQNWIDNVVQPTARQRFRQKVVSVKVISSYACRTRNNARGARMSEHSFGNAIDISSFTLADGRVISVEDDWNGWGRSGKFLRDVHSGSCNLFATVIGPDGDRHHYNHFHLDLGRHGGNGYRYCR